MNAWARYMNVILGIWLVISAFIWPHALAQQTNAWVVGILAAVFAFLAAGRDQARYLNTALALWLVASIWVLPSISVATLWNSGIVAAGLFVFSLIPNLRTTVPPVRRPVETAT